MNLDQLDVQNWIAFPAADFHPRASGLTLLIGPNNAGKSALLSAIDQLRSGQAPPLGLRRGASGGRILAGFQPGDAERRAILEALSGNAGPVDLWMQSDALRRIAWLFEFDANSWKTVEIQATIGGPELRAIARINDRVDPAEVLVAPFQQLIISDPPKDVTLGVSWRQRGITSLDNAGRELARLDESFARWRDSVYHFRPVRQGSGEQGNSANMTQVLEPTGANLPEVLAWIKLNDDNAWSKLQEFIQTVVPGLGRLQVEATGAIRAYFEQPGGERTYLKNAGTGVEQLLMVAVLGVRHPMGGLIVLEEPEANLHAEAQRWLLRYFEEWSRDRQIIAATHSTVFLDRHTAPQASVWIVRRVDQASTLSHAGTDVRQVLDLMGVRLADFLASDGLVLVEGASDARIIDVWFGRSLHGSNIHVESANGGDGAWHVDSMERWLDALGGLRGRTLFVRDRDELDKKAIKQLEKTGAVLVLARRELENYFLDDARALLDVLSLRRQAGGLGKLDWTPSTLRNLIESVAQSLSSAIVLKRLAYELLRARPLPRADVKRLSMAGPKKADVLRAVAMNRVLQRDVAAAWDRHNDAVRRGWVDHWREWVEGSEVLDGVWKLAGLKFDKERDGVLIATSMRSAPDELRRAVAKFVENVRGADSVDA